MFVVMMVLVITGGVVVIATLRFVRRVVVMETEETLDEEHREKPTQHRPDDLIGVAIGAHHTIRMRQQVQQSDAQHQTGDETNGQFHPSMR